MWDARTGQALLTFAGHGSGVLGVALGPDGTRLTTASREATARVWDTTPTGGGEGRRSWAIPAWY